MPSFSKLALASAALAGAANAACPNACSGKGTCGKHDECSCYHNFGGNDCSLRVCPSYNAWVVTPSNGDVNANGNRHDAQIHSNTIPKNKHPTYLPAKNQWESWPQDKTADSTKDEGHYYMECANQGLCDRKTGQCECFTGYTGVGCRRSACPNDCSGFGVCRTVEQIGNALTSHQKVTYPAGTTNPGTVTPSSNVVEPNGVQYTFWDATMSQSCVCDPGYSGPDCSERLCPLGDDPLTTDQHVETQYLDVFSEYQFTGSVKFIYKDIYGETWTTASVDTSHYEGTAGTLASDAEAAFRSLPDQKLSEITVGVNYCEKPLNGYYDVAYSSGGVSVTVGSTNSGVGPRSPAVTISAPVNMLIRRKSENSIYLLDGSSASTAPVYGYPAASDATETDQVLYEVSKKFCTRYEITFTGRSGNIHDLAVDTSSIVVPSQVNEVETTGAGADGSIAQSGTEVTVTVGTLVGAAPNARLNTGSDVHVDCGGTSYGIVRLTAVSATDIKYQAAAGTVAGCTTSVVKIQRAAPHVMLEMLNGVGSVVTDSPPLSSSITTSQVVGSAATHTCTSNGAITSGTFTCTGGTGYDANFHYDEAVSVTCGTTPYGQYTVASSNGNSITFKEAIRDCAASSTVTVTAVDWIIKTDVAVLEVNSDGHTFVGKTISVSDGTDTDYCDVIAVVADASDALTSGTRLRCGNNAGANWRAISGNAAAIQGAGTKEANVCSDRGICDFSVGLCECFKGYYGDDCSTQSALMGLN